MLFFKPLTEKTCQPMDLSVDPRLCVKLYTELLRNNERSSEWTLKRCAGSWMDGWIDGWDGGSLPFIQALFWQQEPHHGFPFVQLLFILSPACLRGLGSVQPEQGVLSNTHSHTHLIYCQWRRWHMHTHKQVTGHWVSGYMSMTVFWFNSASVSFDCTAILCAFCALPSELGRTPWSGGMF